MKWDIQPKWSVTGEKGWTGGQKNSSTFHLPKDLQIDGTLRTRKMEELK